MKHTDRIIGFASDLVPLILNGSKTLTYRLGDKWGFLEAGDTILTENSDTDKVFAELEILNKEKSTFGTLHNNRQGHEMYRTTEERRETFSKYYNRPIMDGESALILEFKVLNKV